MTDASPSTSTDSSPATISPPRIPTDTPPRSPNRQSSKSGSPASPLSPLPPFPAEVFANVLSFLTTDVIAPLCRVSRAWRQYIVNEPRLWSTLSTCLNADEDDMCRYICKRASMSGGKRSTGGIRSVFVTLQYITLRDGRRGDTVNLDFAVGRLRTLLELLHWSSVAPGALKGETTPAPASTSLRSLRVNVWPNTTASATILHELGQASYAPVFANLRDVRFSASLPDFDLRDKFLQMWPTVTSFAFVAQPKNSHIAPVLFDNWSWHNPTVYTTPRFDACDRLESLTLGNVYVGDVELPRLPRLKHLTLSHVRWEGRGIFLLLRLARNTLETIKADHLSFEPVDDPYDDWFKFVDVTDPSLADDYSQPPLPEDQMFDAVPIRLSALRVLLINGTTPPFFATIEGDDVDGDDDDQFPTPVLQMPNLVRCELVDTNVDSAYVDDSLGPLAVLGQNAPKVTHLLLNSLIVTDWSVHCCLAGMHGRITNLDLYQSSVSDQLIVRLPSLVPFLKVLDVRMCDEVTPQGVARMVEVIRSLHDEGESRVERVFLDPPAPSQASIDAYKWLDFIGVLQRDDMDLEGDGPLEPEPRRRWKLEGKKDSMWAHKQEVAAREAKEREQREYHARLAALQASFAGGSSSGAGGASSARRPFAASPPSAPAPLSPAIPHNPLAAAQRDLYAAALQRTLAPIPVHPAPLPAKSTRSLPPHLAPQQHSLTRPPPIFVPAQEQAHVRPAPPSAPVVVEQNEADMDYSFLDGADGGASVIAPEFMRAQADELRRMEGLLRERRRSEAQMEAAEGERRAQAQAAAVLVAGTRDEPLPPVGAVQAGTPARARAPASAEDADVPGGFADGEVEVDAEGEAEAEANGGVCVAPVEDEPFTPLV
ncbi:hypothetical protein JCM3770_006122 [Rhodotorula araucariae]